MAYRIVTMLVGLLLWIPFASEAQQPVPWLQSQANCSELIPERAKRICMRIMQSRLILSHMEPDLIADPKTGRVTAREIILVAWEDETPHVVLIRVPFRVKHPHELVITVMTTGYNVTRLKGTGLYKLQFRVEKQGTDGTHPTTLEVYGGSHVWIPPQYQHEWSQKKLEEVKEIRQYLPFQDHLYHEAFVEHGKRYVESLIDANRPALRNVPSQAFPGYSLSDMYPTEMVLNLIVTEHTDPYMLFDERVHVALPRSAYMLGVLVEIAINGPYAFRDLCSRAKACGWTQFTNTPKKKRDGTLWPGTYTYTYQKCRDTNGNPVILESHEDGTRNVHNAIRAAICYLDLEKEALPQSSRDEFLRDPKHGSIYALAAYNAGGGWSRSVHKQMGIWRSKAHNARTLLTSDSLPRSLFERGKQYNLETHWYIKKYLWVWEILYPNRTITIPQMAVR